MTDTFKTAFADLLSAAVPLSAGEILELLSAPPSPEMGDVAFPCFRLAKELKKAPPAIAADLVKTLEPKLEQIPEIKSILSAGPYLNAFFNRGAFISNAARAVLNAGASYGDAATFSGQTVVIDFSSPNLAKQIGRAHV